MTDTPSAADALKHPLTIEKSTDGGLYSLWQGSAYTGIATKNHVFLAELVTAYNRGLDTRAAAPQEVDKLRDEMFRYMNATKQVSSFNKWRASGFPETWVPESGLIGKQG